MGIYLAYAFCQPHTAHTILTPVKLLFVLCAGKTRNCSTVVQYLFGVAGLFVMPVIALEYVKLACGSSELGS